MRIAIDVTSLRIAQGGVYLYDLNLLQALLRTDHTNEYLLVDYSPVRSDRRLPTELTGMQRPGVQIVRCPGMRYRQLARWPPVQVVNARWLASLIDHTLLWPWAAASRAYMRHALDLVVGQVEVFHSSAMVQWRPPGGVSVLTIYDMATRVLPDCHSADEKDLQASRHRFAQRKADVIVAISEHTKRDIVAYLGIDPARIRVVPGGVGPQFRPPRVRAELESALAPFGLLPEGYILHVGTLEARKNLPRLIEAYAQARHFLDSPAPILVLAGSPGYRAQALTERADDLGLRQEVLILGSVPSGALPSLYGGALALVYPSLYEGFGLPPLEAMACGTPVVASNVPAIRAVVGNAGILVDPYDVGALGRAIRSVVRDADRRASLRQAGLERSAAFTWEAAAGRLLDAYRGSR